MILKTTIQKRFMSKVIRRSHLSYYHGVTSIPHLSDNISERLRSAAEKFPKNFAVISPQQNIMWTYEELDHKVDAFAKGLIATGLKKGDRVGLYSPNRAEWTLFQYAAARADLILVNLNPSF